MKVGDSAVQNVKVSVIMPAYNAEKTIDKSIESVLRQTYQAFELIIINDNSTDHTLERIDYWKGKDSRIRSVNNKKNSGVSVSRNVGVKSALFEWIAFLDSDDLWTADKLEKQIDFMRLHPEDNFFFTGTAYIDENGNSFSYKFHVPPRVTYKELLKQNSIACSSVLINKELLLKHPMHNNPEIHEDLAAWLQILHEEEHAVGLDEALLIYRISKSSKSGNKLKAAKMQWNTYQYIGLGWIKAVSCFLSYAWRNLKKYTEIEKSVVK